MKDARSEREMAALMREAVDCPLFGFANRISRTGAIELIREGGCAARDRASPRRHFPAAPPPAFQRKTLTPCSAPWMFTGRQR